MDNITKILTTNFERIDEDLMKSFQNQNLICNTMESSHQESEESFIALKHNLQDLGCNHKLLEDSPYSHTEFNTR